MEMYGRELSSIKVNELFYDEQSETVEIDNNYFTNYKVWENDCLKNYDDCRKLGLPTKITREEFQFEIQQIIMKQLYKCYERGMGFIL